MKKFHAILLGIAMVLGSAAAAGAEATVGGEFEFRAEFGEGLGGYSGLRHTGLVDLNLATEFTDKAAGNLMVTIEEDFTIDSPTVYVYVNTAEFAYELSDNAAAGLIYDWDGVTIFSADSEGVFASVSTYDSWLAKAAFAFNGGSAAAWLGLEEPGSVNIYAAGSYTAGALTLTGWLANEHVTDTITLIGKAAYALTDELTLSGYYRSEPAAMALKADYATDLFGVEAKAEYDMDAGYITTYRVMGSYHLGDLTLAAWYKDAGVGLGAYYAFGNRAELGAEYDLAEEAGVVYLDLIF